MRDAGSTSNRTNPVLRLEDVQMHFQVRKGFFKSETVRAVDGVSLDLKGGETVAVVGESGSGKTTLGRISLRLIRPTRGRVVFNDTEITDTDEKELLWFRKKAQAVFQDPYSSLDPFMSVDQTLQEPLQIHNIGSKPERREMVFKALEDVKLTPPQEISEKFPHTLSGGQRQRVGIARALILNPDYIVADEPVSMIDASSRAEILYLMRSLQEKYEIAFLYITHDIATARHFSDRIAVMYLGRVVEIGRSRDVINKPLHPYTMALIDSVPEPDPKNRLQERKTLPGEPPSPVNIPPACRFHPRCSYFMKNKCEVQDPRMVKEGKEHHVACHLY